MHKMKKISCKVQSIGQTEISRLPIDMMLTYGCNLNCKKCYAPKIGHIPSYEEIVSTLDKLYALGIRRIVLTGGEALTHKDVVKVAKYAKEKGFAVYLSTNGLNLKSLWFDIAPYLSWVSISLDGSNEKVNELVIGKGGANHYQQVINFLQFYKNVLPKNVKIKLGTVVTKKNKNDLLDLGNTIFRNKDIYKPDVWRLYQFSDFKEHNDNCKYICEFSISEEEMTEAMNTITRQFVDVDISYATAKERDQAYVFIKPEQCLVYSSQGEYVFLKDIKKSSPQDLLVSLHQVKPIWGKCVANREIYS